MITAAVLLLTVAMASCDRPPTPEVYEIRESPHGRLYIVDKNDYQERNESPLLKLIKRKQNLFKRQLNDKQLDYLVDVYKGTNVEDVVYKLIDRLREIRQGSYKKNRNDDRIAINYDDQDDDSHRNREDKWADLKSDNIIYVAPSLRSVKHGNDRTAVPRHYNDYAND